MQFVLEVLAGTGNKELLPSYCLGSSNGSITWNGPRMTIWYHTHAHAHLHTHTHLCDRTYRAFHNVLRDYTHL